MEEVVFVIKIFIEIEAFLEHFGAELSLCLHYLFQHIVIALSFKQKTTRKELI